jgi:hypothetical protein
LLYQLSYIGLSLYSSGFAAIRQISGNPLVTRANQCNEPASLIMMIAAASCRSVGVPRVCRGAAVPLSQLLILDQKFSDEALQPEILRLEFHSLFYRSARMCLSR